MPHTCVAAGEKRSVRKGIRISAYQPLAVTRVFTSQMPSQLLFT